MNPNVTMKIEVSDPSVQLFVWAKKKSLEITLHKILFGLEPASYLLQVLSPPLPTHKVIWVAWEECFRVIKIFFYIFISNILILKIIF
jgi:hypothetical protein